MGSKKSFESYLINIMSEISAGDVFRTNFGGTTLFVRIFRPDSSLSEVEFKRCSEASEAIRNYILVSVAGRVQDVVSFQAEETRLSRRLVSAVRAFAPDVDFRSVLDAISAAIDTAMAEVAMPAGQRARTRSF